MPAQRSQKKDYRCVGYSKATPSAHAGAGPSSVETLFPCEKIDKDAEHALHKLVLAGKKEWEATLAAWTLDSRFKFPIGARVMDKSDAKSSYGFNEKEMMCLKFESVPRSAKTLFSLEDIQDLALRRYEAGVLERHPTCDNPKLNLMLIGGGFTLFEKVDNNSRSHKNFKDISHRHDLDYIRALTGRQEKS
ncbi:hypothetical protein CPB83DRAFT_455322 [Crepidotus variabilis]|uniref:Uncharacterized protein n=1 Tax=Crepidotus variabilis TaxID=179855 RepID=A0A9P6JNI5_9AGAR|nr:hypothetical protein CPB83DRAFT_455322 [Crepidotus variabilis]